MTQFYVALGWVAIWPLAYLWLRYKPLVLLFRAACRLVPSLERFGGRFPRNLLQLQTAPETQNFSLIIGHYIGANSLLGWALRLAGLGLLIRIMMTGPKTALTIACVVSVVMLFHSIRVSMERVRLEVNSGYLSILKRGKDQLVTIPLEQIETLFFERHISFHYLVIRRKGFEEAAFSHVYHSAACRLEADTLEDALKPFGVAVEFDSRIWG